MGSLISIAEFGITTLYISRIPGFTAALEAKQQYRVATWRSVSTPSPSSIQLAFLISPGHCPGGPSTHVQLTGSGVEALTQTLPSKFFMSYPEPSLSLLSLSDRAQLQPSTHPSTPMHAWGAIDEQQYDRYRYSLKFSRPDNNSKNRQNC